MLFKKPKRMTELRALLMAAAFATVIAACDSIAGGEKAGGKEEKPETEVNIETEENHGTAADYTGEINGGITGLASVLTLTLQPGDDTTELNLNWYSTDATANTKSQARFVRGTFAEGYELIKADNGTVNNASTGKTQHKVTVKGLKPGSGYEYAVSSDGTNWSRAYSFHVPAEGAFKFAVIADPQLHAKTWDANNRYTPTASVITAAVNSKTEQGWIETMQKIAAAGVSFIASGGDQVDSSGGDEAEYDSFFAPPGLRTLPFAPVSGNHDNHRLFNYHYNVPNTNSDFDGTGDTEKGRNYFYLYNNILFVVLDTAPYPGSQAAAEPYVRRFDATLAAATKKHAGKYDWLIVQHHKSTASVADHCADRDIQYYVEAGFESVMSKHNVDFVLAGHDHVYARSYPLSGRDNKQVSVPDKTCGTDTNSDGKKDTYVIPNGSRIDPIYLTFTTGSGLKYYAVSVDTSFGYWDFNDKAGDPGTLYVKDNAGYPYLGESITDNGKDISTFAGSTDYMGVKGEKEGMLPVSNAAYVQPYIPSYCIAEVNGKTIKFSTYAIKSAGGVYKNDPANYTPYDFDEAIPYDWVQVTKE